MSNIVDDDRRLHDIYRMRDLSGRLLYIGVTNGGLRRFMEHSKDKTWWREVANIEVEHIHCSRQVIESIEREAIRAERPIYNVVHNRPVVDELPPPVVVSTPHEVDAGLKHSDILDVLRGLGGGGASSGAWLREARTAYGVSDRTFYRARKYLRDAGQIVNVGTDVAPTYRASTPADGIDELVAEASRQWVDLEGGIIARDTVISVGTRYGQLDTESRAWVTRANERVRIWDGVGGMPTKRRVALSYMLVVLAEKGGLFDHFTPEYIGSRTLEWALTEMVEYAGADDPLAQEIIGTSVGVS